MPIIGPRKSPRRPARAAVRGIFMLLAVIQWPPLQAGPPRSSKNPDDLASYDALITPEDRGHWAFQPIKSQPCTQRKEHPLGPQPDRPVRARQARGARVGPPAPAAEPRALATTTVPRPDRATAARQKRQRPFSMSSRGLLMPSRSWLTTCSPGPPTANGGGGTGSTWSGMPSPMATSATPPNRLPGGIAIT